MELKVIHIFDDNMIIILCVTTLIKLIDNFISN